MNDFTICVLLYGDFPDLATRCLRSIKPLLKEEGVALRIGANEISKTTEGEIYTVGLNDHVFHHSAENLKKYPMMRRLFAWNAPDEIKTEFVMWFDDDSFLDLDGVYSSHKDWLGAIRSALCDADMIGSKYWVHLRSNQRAWIQDQPWYTGKEIPGHAHFLTGGWWVIKTEILKKFDWPIPELLHRGGDVMLGQLLHQQGLKIKTFRTGVCINADEKGIESKAKRRGFDSQPIGWDYKAGG